MKFWQATAIITGARRGTPPQDMVEHLPGLEEITKKALRVSGISHEMIESEYPADILGRALLMIELDPNEFEIYLQSAIEKFVQRN